MGIVAAAEVSGGRAELFVGLEAFDPEQLLFERLDEFLDAAVGLGLVVVGGAAGDAEVVGSEASRPAALARGGLLVSALRTGRASSPASGSPQDIRCPSWMLLRQPRPLAGWWAGLLGRSPMAWGCGDPGTDIGSLAPGLASRASSRLGSSSCAPSTVA